MSRFTHLAGKRAQYTSENSRLDPGALLLVPCTDSVLRVRVVEFLGWCALSTAGGECCWPQWLVADLIDPQLTMRCCPPPRSMSVQQPSCCPSAIVGAESPTSSSRQRRRWAANEDAYILSAVAASGGEPVWSEIAEGLPGRNSKQCHARYHQQLHPGIKRGPWSEEEERILERYHKKLGDCHCLSD